MLLETEYQKEGFLFCPFYRGKLVTFPLQNLCKGFWRKRILRDPNWPTLTILEQLYNGGLLTQTETGYLLRPLDFFRLSPEIQEKLPISRQKVALYIEENGNIGSEQYSISWYILLHGKHTGRCHRKGCVVRTGEFDFLLTLEQYRLICEIESWHDNQDLRDRARFQTRCKALAEKAGAEISEFMKKREFRIESM